MLSASMIDYIFSDICVHLLLFKCYCFRFWNWTVKFPIVSFLVIVPIVSFLVIVSIVSFLVINNQDCYCSWVCSCKWDYYYNNTH